MATTYCERADIEAVLSEAGAVAAIDDEESGIESTAEEAYITAAIERAAVEINSAVCRQYVLTDVTSNAWLKWANAVMAAAKLSTRRNNPLPESLGREVQQIRDRLEEIRWGREQLPEQIPSFDHLPTVSNYRPELGHRDAPIRVDVNESTGAAPEGNRKRFISTSPYPYH